MNLFPYILVRITGLPFNIVEQLTLQSQENLEDLVTNSTAVKNHKNDLLKILESASDKIHCGFVLKNLAYLNTNLLHGKKGKLSKKLELNLTEAERSYFGKIENNLHIYHQKLKELKHLESDFENQYLEEISAHRRLLQSLSKSPIILNGLLMSSHSFLNQLQKYAIANVDSFAKKQFQTERTFLKYLARTCCKTSPFSTFSPLSLINLDSEESQNLKSKSSIRLNNSIFALWRDVLNNYPPFYRKQAIGLNPSIEKNEQSWIFMINTKNVESIQKMENIALLEYIFDTLKDGGDELIFEELTKKLLPSVETEIDSLEAFLLELIDFGFLEWRWPFSGLDPFWNEKLKAILQPFKKDPFLKHLYAALDSLQQNIKKAENAEFLERRQIQLDTFAIVKQISEYLLKESQVSDKEEVVDVERIKLLKTRRFKLKVENLFYEDVMIPYELVFDAKELHKIISDLNDLLDCLKTLYFDSFQEELTQFFKNNYKDRESINLLAFYEAFYKNRKAEELAAFDKAIESRLAWQRDIFENLNFSQQDVVNIDLDFIKGLSKNSKRPLVFEKQPSRGTFIQIFQEENLLKGYTETSFDGNGKLMGRFLHLFPPKVTETIKNWNEKHRGELLWIENVDGSIYNPNLHPPLLPYEIRMLGSQNTLPIEKQISIDELAIVFNDLEGRLNLIHKPTDKKAYIFDMGFEALESRSPLYQMLSVFSYPSISQDILAEIVNNYYGKKNKGNIFFQPRICVGDHLIIQRKRWFFPKEILPLKTNNESESAYFIKINQWIEAHQIPSRVFITISPGELKDRLNEKSDNYKPQYIDFKSPVFVQLFHKLIKRVESNLKIEEILPVPMEDSNGKKYGTEYLVQWETEKQ